MPLSLEQAPSMAEASSANKAEYLDFISLGEKFSGVYSAKRIEQGVFRFLPLDGLEAVE